MKYSIRFLLGILLLNFQNCAPKAYSITSHNKPGEMNLSFVHFSSKDKVNFEGIQGHYLFLNYITQLSTGKISIQLNNESKIIWQQAITTATDTEETTILIPSTGNFTLSVIGSEANGSVSLRYTSIAPKNITVKTNKNIELFGLMMQLDMGPDLVASKDSMLIDNKKATWRDWYAQGYKNYLQFREFDSCTFMQEYRTMVSNHLYNDFFVSLLQQVAEVPNAQISDETDIDAYLPFSASGNKEEAQKKANKFLQSFNQFYQDIHFDKFLAAHAALYEKINAEVRKNLPDPALVPAMEKFYSKSFNGYFLIPSLNTPTSMGFGKTNKIANTISNTFGPFSFQQLEAVPQILGFDYPDRIHGLSVHEFGHSFVNPAIDHVPQELINATSRLYLPIKEAMSKKSYTSWVMCLYEHFVIAGQVIIARKLHYNADADKILSENTANEFIYLPFIVKELEAFNKDPNPNKSYHQFVVNTLQKMNAQF